jgi:predicted DNA-binding antitoxin AbrB/MazE fold protein
MTNHVDAVYENGVLRPLEPLALQENQRVRVAISSISGDSLASLVDQGFLEQARQEVAAAAGDYTPAQRCIVNTRLAKADEDLKAGRVYGPFDTAEEMAASIEENIRKDRAAKRKAKSAR